jgi:hypothetical protein
MNEVSTIKKNSFSEFMGKMEQVGFLLLNQESVMADDRQHLCIPAPFQGFMNSQDLI